MSDAGRRVGPAEVLHMATLARLHLTEARAGQLATELDGILSHMDALQAAPAPPSVAEPDIPAGHGGRDDTGHPDPLARARDAWAPEMRDGFFLVPRLETHEDGGGRGGA